jgi:hypothetical protein
VRGAPAVPATVLLEYAIDLGTWATPPGAAGQPWRLHTLRDVRLWLDALTCPSDDPYAFTCDAEGDWDGRAWKVTVSLDRIPGSDGAPVPLMRLHLGYVAAPLPARAVSNPAPGSPLAPAIDAGPDFAPDRSCYGWQGLILAPLRWRGHPERPGARRLADVRPVPPADVWAVPHPPLPALPFAHLEHALQAAVALAAPPTAPAGPSPACLLVREVRRYQSLAVWNRLASPGAGAEEDDWLAGDGDGRVGLALAGVCLTADPGAAP